MIEHYGCGGELVEQDSQEYECRKCGNKVRAVVVDEQESFKRVAERGGPASDIAQDALEGVQQ